MKSDIFVCADWDSNHNKPVYSISNTCHSCGGIAENSAPPPFNPQDPYAAYRQALKQHAKTE